jgi:uncharacterized BrkB/YihY/UPF0761 family membrane protein
VTAPTQEETPLGEEPTFAETIRELANQDAGTGRLAQRRKQLLERAEKWTTVGPLAPVAEVAWAVNRRTLRVGGSALAALVAYRLFVWLLPFALVAVFVIELFHDEPLNPRDATDTFGIAGYVGASISQATATAGGPGLVSGLVIGGLVLLYATYALLRALRVVHALVWHTRPTRIQRPLPATVFGLAVLVGIMLGRGFLDGVVDSLAGPLRVLLELATYALVPALWLVLSRRMPNRARHWTDLVPGALLIMAGAAVIHALVALVLFPYLEQKAETYGGLGLAAGLMLALYGIGWLVTASAALNAELVDRRQAREAAGTPT